MESISKDVEDPSSPPRGNSESQKPLDGEAVKVPKLVKPVVEIKLELIEFYQAEAMCW